MKIVVLDGFLVTRGDLTFDCLRPFGDVTVYPCTAQDAIIGRIGDAQAVIANRTPIGRDVFAQCRSLRYIGVTGTGVNIIDLDAARAHAVTVCNVPAYSSDAVAQMTFALLLEIARNTALLAAYVRAGKWTDPLDPTVAQTPAFELSGRVMGIVGLGGIGMKTARIAQAFGMRVIGAAHTPGAVRGDIRCVDLDTVLRASDVLSLHCPLTEATRGLIDASAISRMKEGAVLLNTARGPILNEDDVVDALDSGKLYAAGLDVLAHEPPYPTDRLAFHPRCVATPHVAWAPRETRARLLEVLAGNMARFLAGDPCNVVR